MTMALVQKVQEIYRAFGEGRIADVLSVLSPDVIWEHDIHEHGIPWLKERQGPEEVGLFFQALADGLDITRFEPRSLMSNETQVAGVVDFEARSRVNGRIIRDLEMHLFTFENGQVTRFKHLADTHQHWLAAQRLS